MPEISLYSIVLFIHIASAIALVGGSLVARHIRALVVEASSLPELRTALLFARRTARLNPLFAVVLLATALYMGSFGWWRQPWFLVAFGGWWTNFLLAHLVIKRTSLEIATLALRNGEGLSPRVDELRRSARWGTAARVMLGVDFSLLYLMLNKPGLAGSLAVVAVGAGSVAAVAIRLHLPRPTARHTGNVRATAANAGEV